MADFSRRRFVTMGAVVGAAMLGAQARAEDRPAQSARRAVLITATPLQGDGMESVQKCVKELLQHYLKSIPGVQEIKTEISPSKLVVALMLKRETDMQATFEEVETMMAQVEPTMSANLAVSTRGQDAVA